MKKLKLLILVLILTQQGIFSQSLVRENKLWSNVKHGGEYGSDFESYYIKFEGDTVISDIQFKKVYRSNDSLMTSWSFYGSIRETDSGSVYYMSGSADMERLLYDFGVDEGDTIKLDGFSQGNLYVDSVRLRPFGNFNENRKFIYIRNEIEESIWIEGVGSVKGILYDSRNLGTVGEANNLVCFYENDSLKYHMDYYSSCFPYGKYTSIESNVKKIPITIKDYNDLLVFDLGNLQNQTYFQLFDLSGRGVWTEKIQNQKSVSLEKDKFEDGIYIYIIHNSHGFHSGKVILN